MYLPHNWPGNRLDVFIAWPGRDTVIHTLETCYVWGKCHISRKAVKDKWVLLMEQNGTIETKQRPTCTIWSNAFRILKQYILNIIIQPQNMVQCFCKLYHTNGSILQWPVQPPSVMSTLSVIITDSVKFVTLSVIKNGLWTPICNFFP